MTQEFQSASENFCWLHGERHVKIPHDCDYDRGCYLGHDRAWVSVRDRNHDCDDGLAEGGANDLCDRVYERWSHAGGVCL